MRTSLTSEIRSFIVKNFLMGKGGTLSDESSFLELGIIDSTGMLELLSFLEETYEIEISNDELTPENLDSVSKIAVYLAGKLSRQTTEQVPLGQKALVEK